MAFHFQQQLAMGVSGRNLWDSLIQYMSIQNEIAQHNLSVLEVQFSELKDIAAKLSGARFEETGPYVGQERAPTDEDQQVAGEQDPLWEALCRPIEEEMDELFDDERECVFDAMIFQEVNADCQIDKDFEKQLDERLEEDRDCVFDEMLLHEVNADCQID
eukprot:CAMPEP_0179163576 /NCGR_PEP_ID=MMETSP0796-20121207/80218_1 /TAXON_ID=73915 /ORGANISM="Pyrodinium bahamense, Strain pbaha01" /LENGTH=159 /DNA_ID=CAMNT_0020865925 /DNA_START=112 /DNA_END=588 /DNA_ORIENTATION=+